MTANSIQKLLSEGEGLTVEFKKCIDKLSNTIFETICSFSNRYGGHLLLGVDDDGTPIGVNPTSVPQMKKDFANMLNNPQKTSPSLFLSLEEVEIGGTLLLYTYVPVSSQIQACSGRIYDRNEDGDFDITNSTDLVAQLSIRKSNQFTEREVFPYAREEHLLLDKLMPMVRNMAASRIPNHPWKAMSDMEIMKSAGLYDEDFRTGKNGFNKAAILLFGREETIQQVAPGYVTDCLLRVKNLDRYDDRLRVESNLIESFSIIMGFIAKHTNDPFFLIDNHNISVRDNISKEVVSNILVHREYSGTFPARVIIEKDRLVAENWNRALRHGRIDLNNFEPYPKNPILARFFVNIGYADTLGSGVRNLVKYTKLYSSAEPELIEGEVFKIIIPLGSNVSQLLALDNGVDGDDLGVNGDDLGVDGDDLGVNGDDLGVDGDDLGVENKILNAITAQPEITQKQLATSTGLSERTISREIKQLRDSGKIYRIGSDRAGHWEIRKITKEVESNSNPQINLKKIANKYRK